MSSSQLPGYVLKAHKYVPVHSRLVNLAPEWDSLTNLIRVGGRLRRLADSEPDQIHPLCWTRNTQSRSSLSENLTSGYYILRESMLRCGDSIGFSEDVRPLSIINSTVCPFSVGEPSRKTHKWHIYHLSASDCSVHPFTQQALTASAHTWSK